jgi:hypothetical protein
MTVVYLTHGLFLTCTQKNHIYLQVMHHDIYTNVQYSLRKNNPLYQQYNPALLGEQVSLLMVTNSHPPLSLVCQQLLYFVAFTPLTLSHSTDHITLFFFFSPLYVYSIFYIKDNTKYYDDGRREIKRGIIPHRITVDINNKKNAS